MLDLTKMKGLSIDYERLAIAIQDETGEKITGRTLRNYANGKTFPTTAKIQKIAPIVRRFMKPRKAKRAAA